MARHRGAAGEKPQFEIPRPEFPKRAVVTGGMPYGNKELHFGHVGGMLVFADTYARFLRDRIGKENVIFVSGTDCYGSPIAEGWRKKVESGEFEGSLEDFVRLFPADQVRTGGQALRVTRQDLECQPRIAVL